MDIKGVIKNYILENFFFTDDQSVLSDSSSLIETGVVDSTGIVEIVTFIEDEFEIRIRPEEMLPEYLDSVDRIVEFVKIKRSSCS